MTTNATATNSSATAGAPGDALPEAGWKPAAWGRLGHRSALSFCGQRRGTPGQRPSPGSPRFSGRRGNLWLLMPVCRDEGRKAERRKAAGNVWRWQGAKCRHCSPPQKKENGDKRRRVVARRGPGGLIAPSHGLTVSTALGSPRTEPPGLQEPKTKGGRKRNSCLDKHEVEKAIGRGIWAPRTFSNHKFSKAVLKPGNLSWLSEIYYLRSRQGQLLASSLIPTLSSLWPRSRLVRA